MHERETLISTKFMKLCAIWEPDQFDVVIDLLYWKWVFPTKGIPYACFKKIENVDVIGFFLKKLIH